MMNSPAGSKSFRECQHSHEQQEVRHSPRERQNSPKSSPAMTSRSVEVCSSLAGAARSLQGTRQSMPDAAKQQQFGMPTCSSPVKRSQSMRNLTPSTATEAASSHKKNGVQRRASVQCLANQLSHSASTNCTNKDKKDKKNNKIQRSPCKSPIGNNGSPISSPLMASRQPRRSAPVGGEVKSAAHTCPPQQASAPVHGLRQYGLQGHGKSQQRDTMANTPVAEAHEQYVALELIRSIPPSAHNICYICGINYTTPVSLEVHVNVCRKLFELRESRRPPGERRPLLEESQMPVGVGCLQMYYDGCDGDKTRNASLQKSSTNHQLPSEYSEQSRRFASAQKPQSFQDSKKTDSTKRSSKSSPTAKAARASCQQAKECPKCKTNFKPHLFREHLKHCSETSSPQQPRGKIMDFARAQQPGLGLAGKTVPKAAAAVCASRGKSPPPCPPKSLGDNETQLSSAILLARGCIFPASSYQESQLRAEFATALPDAVFVRAFKVMHEQSNMYYALRSTMQTRLPGSPPPRELELWHGTSWVNVPEILQHGFNRSFAGRHGTLLGVATYFSNELAYSQRFCDRHGAGADATKVMIRARVLVGNYCKGASECIEPPVMDAATGTKYDSTVDSTERPKIFAVFKDFQAVPLFLVEFQS